MKKEKITRPKDFVKKYKEVIGEEQYIDTDDWITDYDGDYYRIILMLQTEDCYILIGFDAQSFLKPFFVKK